MKNTLLLSLVLAISTLCNSQNYENIVNYNINGTPTHGVKIKTNIPFQNQVCMPTVTIKGYDFGATPEQSAMLGLNLVWYVWNGVFDRYSVSSFGSATPPIYLANENGKIVIFINEKIYLQRFTVSVYSKGQLETPSMFTGWSVVDEPVGNTNKVSVPYKNRFGHLVTDGKIGIGTTNPLANMQIGNNWTFQDMNTEKVISRNSYHNGTNSVRILEGAANRIHFTGNGEIVLQTAVSGSANSVISIWNLMIMKNDGSVGIGTLTPREKFEVAGTIRATEVKVMPSTADFVFDPNYDLRPLQEVETFIKQNKHLPDIPSAEQMEQDGIGLAEMNKLLLQKVEELTLYVIEQQKNNRRTETRNRKNKISINKLGGKNHEN